MAKTAIKFATIIEHSLTPKEAGERLGVTTSCIRRMIANRSLYSFLINRTRYVPDFQFTKNRLIPGIAIVCAAYNDHTPEEVADFDIKALFNELDLISHLSTTRGNGLCAMVARIRETAVEFAG